MRSPSRCTDTREGCVLDLGFLRVSELQPEFLVLDEVFSGGDRDFREKSKRRMFELVEQCRGMFIISQHGIIAKSMQ